MLGYCPVPSSPIPIPARKLNGGLYTGEPFSEGSGWANVPIEPRVEARGVALDRMASPGAGQVPMGIRPGNNEPQQLWHETLDSRVYPNVMCLRK